MSTLAALVFDVDGTLAETEEAHRRAFNETFAAWGLDWRWDEALYESLLKTTGGKERIAAYQRAHLDRETLSPEEIVVLHARKTARYGEIVAEGGLVLRPGVAGLIERARVRGLKVAVATTTDRANVEALCRATWRKAAHDVFDVVAAGDEVKAKKPAPDIYLLALARLGLPAAACIAFEDSHNGLLSARAAGLRVYVTPSRYTGSEIFDGAEAVMKDLAGFQLD